MNADGIDMYRKKPGLIFVSSEAYVSLKPRGANGEEWKQSVVYLPEDKQNQWQ